MKHSTGVETTEIINDDIDKSEQIRLLQIASKDEEYYKYTDIESSHNNIEKENTAIL